MTKTPDKTFVLPGYFRESMRMIMQDWHRNRVAELLSYLNRKYKRKNQPVKHASKRRLPH